MRKITYKQLADEMGVSKEKIRYQARKLPPSCVVKENGVIYLTEKGEVEIRKALGATPTQVAPEPPAKADQMVDVLKATLDTLQAQLAEKDKQIADLTEANKELTNANKELAATVKAQAQSINADRYNELATTLNRQQLTDGKNEQSLFDKIRFWRKR